MNDDEPVPHRVVLHRVKLDGIPIIMLLPDRQSGPVVLWLSHLGGSAEATVPVLRRIAAVGNPAVSFDAPGHGARGRGDPWDFANKILADIRSRMWPLLAQTTVEAMRVLTWAQRECNQTGEVRAGGVSMGGDVAIALAGVDARVRRVATIGSTPDWNRPGMCRLDDPTALLPQPTATAAAQFCADLFDPGRHLHSFQGGPSLWFQLGGADHHIPVANTRDFVAALRAVDPAAAARTQVTIHVELDHLGVTTSPGAQQQACSWLTK